MEAENKLYAEMHGEDQHQPSQYPPQYTPTTAQQAPDYSQYPSTMPGTPYYAPSGAVYGGGYGAPPPPQQQQVTVVTASQPQPVIYVNPGNTYAGAIAYACIVAWCFNCLFGIIAYFLAMENMHVVRVTASARDSAASDPEGARKLGRASYIVSSVGIVVSIIIIAVYFGVFHSSYSCYYNYGDGHCYNYKSCNVYTECEAKGGVFHGGCCYYD